MKTYIKYIIALWLFNMISGGCQKSPMSYNDLSGDSTIRGTAVVYDTLAGAFVYYGIHPVPVYLKYSSDTTGYLYSTTTNALGQYFFNGIDPGKDYIVFANYDTMQIRFYGQTEYVKGGAANYQSDSLKLYPSQTNQNGIFIQVQDSTGGVLPGAKVYLFTSESLWLASDTAGNTYTLTSDNFGRVLKLNISPGVYWMHAMGKFGNITIGASDSALVGNQGIRSKTIQLLVDPKSNVTGMEYFLLDTLNGPLVNCNFYVFTSQVLWNNNDSVGSAYQAKSDVYGRCVLQGIPAGQYFVTADAVFKNLELKAKDTLTVYKDSLTVRNLKLQKQ